MNREELRADAKRRAQAAQRVEAVDGWPGAFVRALTAGEVDSSKADVRGEGRRGMVGMALYSLCDANGERVYDPTNQDDWAEIDGLPSTLLGAVNTAAAKVNALSEEGQVEAGNG